MTDYFGELLDVSDVTLQALRQKPKDTEQFRIMMRATTGAIVEVLECQYRKYFDTAISEKLIEEMQSARTHNIDAEEVMGMFSTAQKRHPVSCPAR